MEKEIITADPVNFCVTVLLLLEEVEKADVKKSQSLLRQHGDRLFSKKELEVIRGSQNLKKLLVVVHKAKEKDDELYKKVRSFFFEVLDCCTKKKK